MQIWKINITGKGVCLDFSRWTQRMSWLPLWKIRARGATGIQDTEETAKSPRGGVSSTSHRLSDGRCGEVIMINKHMLSRPLIRCSSHYIDLSKEPDVVYIEDII